MKRINVIVLVFLLPLIAWGIMNIVTGWGVTKNFDIYTETITMGNANTAIRSDVFTGNRFMTLAILPGGAVATADSFHQYGVSTNVDISMRGWTDKSRTVCLGVISLFDPFQMVIAADSSNADSTAMAITCGGVAYAAIINAAGSTYTNINNVLLQELWPYVDVSFDNTTDDLGGKGAQYKFKVIGHTPN